LYKDIHFLTLRQYLKALSEIVIQPDAISTAKNAFYVGKDSTTIIYKGTTSPGLVGKGFKYIQFLIMQENKHVDNLELLKLYPPKEDTEMVEESDTIEKADKTTLEWLRSEILSLKKEREEATENDDLSKLDQINERLEQLEGEWKRISRTSVESKNVTKPKKFPSNEYRQRDSVKQAILRAIKKLKGVDRKTWEHFDRSLKPVGIDYNRYLPDEHIDWDIK
jgi:hypothetical protein